MCVSVLCFPAAPVIAGCCGAHGGDGVSPLLHGLVAGEEAARDAGGERWSGKNCTCQEQVRLSPRELHDYQSALQLLHQLPHAAG